MTNEKVEKVKEFIEFTFDEISDTIDPCTCCHYERRRDNCEDCCSWDRLKESIISQFEYMFLDKEEEEE